MRVQVATYNGYLGQGSLARAATDLSKWLAPAPGVEPPDVFAVSFQEVIPLHRALLGLTSGALDAHDALIRPAISSHIRGGASSLDDLDEEESFTLAARGALGGTALLVYTRDATISARVQSVQIQTAACGVLGLMGNKGGVGARIVLGKSSGSSTAVDGEGDGDRVPLMSAESSIRGDEQEEVLTFVAAHLAAHDSGLERRNSDYRQIVRRLVFPQDSLRGVLSQIYSSSYLFFAGDLNYRINASAPRALSRPEIVSFAQDDVPTLLKHDQLRQEQERGKTLQHLWEPEITFPPTYKYEVGSVASLQSKRTPGWCDRILLASWADGDGEIEGGKGCKCEQYTSQMDFVLSDHKPVTALFSCPTPPTDTSGEPLRIPHANPFAADPAWRRKQLIGLALDRSVGFVWSLVLLCGGGWSLKLGAVNLSVILATLWYYRARLA